MEEITFDPIERKEFFLAKLGGQEVTPPDAVTRIEHYLKDIIDGNASTIPPITRIEYYLAKISGADVAIPDPVTRTEYYLAKIAGMDVDVPDPVTREECLLAEWAESLEHTYGPAALVSFETSRAKLVKSLLIALQPIQDLHGYDHPWPAGGGKNKLKIQDKNNSGITGSYNSAGEYVIIGTSGSVAAYCDFQPVTLPAGSYTFSISTLPDGLSSSYSKNGSWAGFVTDGTTITLTEETEISGYISIAANTEANTTIKIQLESGSSATAWTPYENICPITGRTGLSVYVSPTQDVADATTYAVDWTSEAGTVYGGTVDVVTGVLTVDRANIPSYNGETITEPWLSSMDEYTPGATPTTGAQVVYKLATPVTYQLTPQEVKSLVGQNVVWSDAGEVTVKV